MDDIVKARRQRLIYRSSYTGMKETDLLLGNFARRYVPEFTLEQLDRYAELLDKHSDQELFAWMTGGEVPPRAAKNDVSDLLCRFRISD
jgi:antitoxin CptB